MKKYEIKYLVKGYDQTKVGFREATGIMRAKAKNTIDAINQLFENEMYQWGAIYEDELGYYPTKVVFVKIISVNIVREVKEEVE